MLSELDKRLLYELQYNFPLTPTPFEEVARALGISQERVLERTKELMDNKIIKRIGFTVNYKSMGKVAALVGVKVRGRKDVEALKAILMNNPEVTHNYLRDDPDYQVWFTIKAKNMEVLKEEVKNILEPLGLNDYVVLPSKKVCKVSVRYDPIRGIAWSPYSPQKDEVPKPEDLGLPEEFPKDVSRLKPVERPYAEVAKKYGMSEEEVVEKVKLLLREGVLRNPGASVDGDKIGFKYNSMIVMKVDDDVEVCRRIAEEVPEASHVVARVVDERWPYPVYFVLHATKKELVEDVASRVIEKFDPYDYRKLYSLENLKPGVAR
ncbi:transcriptional regulator, AsnC family [Ignicoccus hospitalis KIN4/I]|uniref:siroheme decarboxylase n=1 Tax=Ignicoccus hospitalis (strain KIN4/I / DSM 18386 / JCM 14125) TaxID=453591 RepID=A8AAR9_IGNH4|nr:transcriptional regulator, AsnC family [Ignicoccus hospitalis KIN4/I]